MQVLTDNEFKKKLNAMAGRMYGQNWLIDDDINLVSHIISNLGCESVLDVVKDNNLINAQNMELQCDTKRINFVIINSNCIEVLITRTIYGETGSHRTKPDLMKADDEEENLLDFLEKELTEDTKVPAAINAENDTEFHPMDKLAALSLLGFSDPKENWLDSTSLVLIPILGPQLSSNCFTMEDFLKRNHWSLLCYHAETNTIFHYDSVSSHNTERAKEIIATLQLHAVLPPNIKEKLNIEFSPKQNSCWECGYIVIFLMIIMLSKVPPRPLSRQDVFRRFENVNTNTSSDLMEIVLCLAREKMRIDAIFT
jgi:hypothetical protein